MPRPSKLREDRIQELTDYFQQHNTVTQNEIFEEALSRWPFVRETTVQSYAQAAYRILKKKGT